jgi:hypothetical protein
MAGGIRQLISTITSTEFTIVLNGEETSVPTSETLILAPHVACEP